MAAKGAYAGCKWCGGRGCLQCDIEREKDAKRDREQLENPQPIFEADLNNPDDVALLKLFFGREAIEHAWGKNGDGVREIGRNAAIASLLQKLHREKPEAPNAS